ncbi:SGNH/GDSL hydrolase family protein [Desulfatibacillum alkenivorans]|nr:SGNH/GDSL hydrolase family protein [Desulfatibacillum alkenivorans]
MRHYRPKLFVLSAFMLGLLLLTGAAEALVRATHADQCQYSSFPGAEAFLPDPDLGWVLKPGFDAFISYDQHRVSINSMGLRSPEVSAKQPGEFRVLCLGESTTFGAGLANGRDYPSILEKLLSDKDGAGRYTVINAGVPAWSSYQSREFLRTRGAELSPDLVVVYHEVNDYLPVLVRKTYFNQFGEMDSDEQLYGSRSFRALSVLAKRSALVRFALKTKLLLHMRTGQYGPAVNDLHQIGMPGMTPNLLLSGDFSRPENAEGNAPHPRRVTDQERVNNFYKINGLCKKMGAGLLIIHPCYAYTRRHECPAVQFCREEGVPMLEAYDVLGGRLDLFQDFMHPNAEGHKALASALLEFIKQNKLPE